ncbi:bifunctional 3-(3-hydroxy-phenyl)propionate/3-hydroxycinnamic acid hydroxylase [uncultured Jatrophihabitans sp.]|uniref:bifunctional 3-(3-hydroxy-phenyl)propionate/3-hydroxycinnamic acid hydroxylase MhpA n=1 Tax=uncultured Jatrophihabitans sp. TaxID=1610747 RepID=UPI0035C99834
MHRNGLGNEGFEADVAVVGYGPTGMAMAGLLAQAGHRVLVLERYAGLYNLPRAAIFDDETMRTLDKLGIAEQMAPKLHVQRNYEWVNAAGQLLIDHSFAERGRSGWAEWYMMYQPELEDALDAACRALPNLRISHGATVVDLEQDDSGVVLHVEELHGTRRAISCRYAVACDGGNSAVRRKLAIGEDDYGFSEPWMVCDFRLTREVQLPSARQVGDPAKPVSIISLGPRHHRFSFMLDSAADFELASEPALIWARVADYLHPDDAELIRVATYTFRSLVADRWRDGRIVLAGDAAHQMPPFLGQGMCSGIRDAQNLAFKFDLLLRGRRGAELLDTYQLERGPHVRAVVEKGIELGRLQTVRDPVAAAERDQRLIAARAEGHDTGSMRFPGLHAGLLSSSPAGGRGELSIQADVDDAGRRGRFDEVLGRGFALIVTAEVYGLLSSDGTADALRSAGVVLAGVTQQASHTVPGSVVLDVDGTYGQWFADHGVVAVAVRPDFYVYGSAADAPAASELATELLRDLGADGSGTDSETPHALAVPLRSGASA